MYKIEWQNAKNRKNLNAIVEYLNANGAHFEKTKEHVYYIVPNNYKELVAQSGIKLGSFITSYSGRIHSAEQSASSWERCPMTTETEYQGILQREKDKEERQKQQLQAKAEAMIALNELRNSFSGSWRDDEWIKAHIGEYYTEEVAYQYYWSLIGERWKVVDWKHNIELEKDIYDIISTMNVLGLKGTTFLSRGYKNPGGYCARIVGYYYPQAQHFGVYCIRTCADNKIIYIGSTTREFQYRFQEHRENFANNSAELALYSRFAGQDVKYEILIDCGELKATDGKNGNPHIFTEYEIKAMELALIHEHKPEGNIAGNTREFIF